MYFCDFINPLYNLAANNQTKPPVYGVSIIIPLKTFWVGNEDGLVLLKGVQRITNDMIVSAKLYHLDGPGLAFDHNSFALRRDVARLLVIPSLKEMGSISIYVLIYLLKLSCGSKFKLFGCRNRKISFFKLQK